MELVQSDTWVFSNPTKIYGINVFLVTEIKPEYFDILYNQTHFPGPLVCRIRQVPLYIDFVKFSNLFLVGLLNLLTLSTNYLSEYNEWWVIFLCASKFKWKLSRIYSMITKIFCCKTVTEFTIYKMNEVVIVDVIVW
jgi:hypothetical protein